MQGFNTQPPEGGWPVSSSLVPKNFCFNTQPPEGGWEQITPVFLLHSMFQHTAARRRLANDLTVNSRIVRFQHTAARRRLDAAFY